MAAAAEQFTNQPIGTVTTGGTTTSDTAFTVTATSAFPVASTTPTPNTVFRIVDQANTSEIILVTVAPGGAGAGQSWTVVRGAEGTTAITHSANWTCQQIISAGSMDLFGQNDFAGNTAVIPIATTTTETAILSWQPATQDVPAAGVAYTFNIYGTILTTTATATATLGTLTFNVRWGSATGTLLCSLVTGANATALAASSNNQGFWVEGLVNCLSATSMTAGLNWIMHRSTSLLQGVAAGALDTASTNTNTSAGLAGITVSGTGPLVITGKWSAANNQLFASGQARRVQ